MVSRFRSLPLLVVILLMASLAMGVTAAHGASTAMKLKREVEQLKFKQAQLRYTLEVVRGQRTAARERIHTLETKIKSEREWSLHQLHSNAAEIRRQDRTIDRLTIQRDQALSGLPDAILAVPVADFGRLVFTPARQAWPCDDFHAAGGLWSLAFRSAPFCS